VISKLAVRSAVALLAISAAASHAAVTPYTTEPSFTPAAGSLRALSFVIPDNYPYQQTRAYNGVCFNDTINYYSLSLYNYPGVLTRFDLPPGTYAVGMRIARFYQATPPETLYSFDVATSEGTFTFTRPSVGIGETEPVFFGVISTTPIRWMSMTHPLEYHVILDFKLTSSAGSVVSCPVPGDTAGPISSAVVASPTPAQVGVPLAISANVSDATTGGLAIASAEYSLGGPYAPMSGPFNGATSINVSASATGPSQAGVYSVCVRGTDALGNLGAPACEPVVVYDPNAGFVTGGGWITSPAGAYRPDPTLSGKATFGFVSRYVPGAHVPEGNTQFVFHGAKMNFQSTSYEWLVVAGARAQYKGAGVVNGVPGYSFLLTAIDGALPGGGGSDRLRVKIWGDNGVLYDNQLNAPDSADPSTALGGGSIIIHKK
jgi:hypothetical protein